MSFRESELRAFLAGDASPAKTQEIEAAMMSDHALERRIMALDRFAPQVREVMGQIPGSERVERIEKALPNVQATRRGFLGSSIAASIAVGVTVGWLANGYFYKESSGWRVEAASYQALYVAETVAHLDQDPVVVANQFKRASTALGISLPQEALAKVDALTLARAQVLGFEGKPLIQIVFKSETGAPIALCIMGKDKASNASQIETYKMNGLASASWADQGYEFFLIGGKNDTSIEKWAHDFKDVFAHS